ncbi:MAG: lipopolysaccharide biosynthesis protein, partial [Porcipelethomonas sp.]
VLKQNDDEEKGIAVSFLTIGRKLRRLLSLWLVISVAAAFFTVGAVLLLSKTTQSDNITALVSFKYDGIASGLDPDGGKLDVNKIKAPNIIEGALSSIGESLTLVEPVRRNISIDGVIPNEALDKIALYQEIYTKGGSAGLEAVNALLDIGYFPSYYIIEFDNYSAGIDLDTGKKIVDAILDEYQDYFFTTYSYNKALGNSVVAVDYKDYDYPAAIDVFKSTLDDLDEYVRELRSDDTVNFRSNTTGFSFDDILRDIQVIKTADLDSLSSYVTINNITNDREQLITYYNYKIDELNRQANVIKSELQSVSESISSYEKDELLIFGDNDAVEDSSSYSQVSEKYDELIERRVSVQEEYSAKLQNIEYYKSRLNSFKNNTQEANVDLTEVDQSFEALYAKITNIVEIVTETADEYYENVVFANAFNILVPAIGELPSVQLVSFVFPLILVEAVIFIIYLGYSFISAFAAEYKKQKNKEEDTEE